MQLKKSQIVLIIVLGLTIISAIVIYLFVFVFQPAEDAVRDTTDETETQEFENDIASLETSSQRSLIDGKPINEEEERMIAVVIENQTASRPQMTGLSDASIVFEAEAEGGITRFLAFYPYQLNEKVGPVRSARPYFVRWAEQFDSAFVHAGASQLAFSTIYQSGNILDVDGLALEGGKKYFVRDYTYSAPHNLFVNLEDIRELMEDKKWDKALQNGFVQFEELSEVELAMNAESAQAESIYIYYPFPEYFVTYTYDKQENTYKRYLGGDPHMDNGNNQQIKADNVGIMVTNYYAYDDEGRLKMTTEGTGDFYLFRDGKILTGKWEKNDILSPLTFSLPNGEEMPFKEGNIWISVINFDGNLQWN